MLRVQRGDNNDDERAAGGQVQTIVLNQRYLQ